MTGLLAHLLALFSGRPVVVDPSLRPVRTPDYQGPPPEPEIRQDPPTTTAWELIAGYTAGRYLDILPGAAVYPGEQDLDKGPQVMDIAAAFGKKRYKLDRDRLRSLSRNRSSSLIS